MVQEVEQAATRKQELIKKMKEVKAMDEEIQRVSLNCCTPTTVKFTVNLHVGHGRRNRKKEKAKGIEGESKLRHLSTVTRRRFTERHQFTYRAN